jgi:NitT/TauT family transport system ATP-binding protein
MRCCILSSVGFSIMASAAPHISLRGVTKIFPAVDNQAKVHALGPVDLDIVRGEFFSVVGPSGCGKSTLLDLLAGLSIATEGRGEFNAAPLRGVVPEGVGVVFQQDATFAWLTVRDNVAFGLRRRGMYGAEIKRRVDHALTFMGLGGFAEAYPAQLSGGMRQRVCIARTLVLEPELLLLDEPFGSLDQQTRLLMGDELLRIWRETGATVVLITHSLDEAAMLSDRIGVMSARPGRFTSSWRRVGRAIGTAGLYRMTGSVTSRRGSGAGCARSPCLRSAIRRRSPPTRHEREPE